ncbi:alanine racemase [Pseudoalteromonas sp. T1lg24]|uniref:alanine racemase n=1 Tax=Pseudoalteromonas sp. T1lg24 TaxID=2077099 RepID=UPI000CF6078F|nr:alanine racemase [Pseudoalteromonas sp. T1lg24]
MRLACAEINLTALNHNLARVKELAPGSRIMAVLKANAYGHGLVTIAQNLVDADAFAVARIDEALALRAGGVIKPIVLLEGVFRAEDLAIAATSNFNVVVHDEAQLVMLENAQLASPITAWLKLDTGMHRLGIEPSQCHDMYTRLERCVSVAENIKLMTHFACADDLDDRKTTEQMALFFDSIKGRNNELCLANSAGIVGWPNSHCDWVRPGLMLYGVSPMIDSTGQDHQLTAVMRLTSSIIAIRDVKAGETVGYGSAWRAASDTRIGVVAMGYGDGYPRHAPNGTPVMIQGKRFAIVGRVSMDMITVELGDDDLVVLGDEVELWGPNLPVEQIAQFATTIPYELLCNITPRVEYKYIQE